MKSAIDIPEVNVSTAYEKAGMEWWNRSTEWARAYWLKRAGSAIPAEAWACYLGQSQPPRGALRLWSGIEVQGADLAIGILPGIDGALGVRVVAHPGLTGFSNVCSLGTDSFSRLRFSAEGIKINHTSLECFALDTCAPLVSEGFRANIETHMADTLRAWLPRLAETAVLAAAVACAAKRALGNVPHAHYLDGFVSGLAALVVLDGLTASAATHVQCSEHWASKEKPFMDVLQGVDVQTLLEAAAFRSRHIAAKA